MTLAEDIELLEGQFITTRQAEKLVIDEATFYLTHKRLHLTHPEEYFRLHKAYMKDRAEHYVNEYLQCLGVEKK